MTDSFFSRWPNVAAGAEATEKTAVSVSISTFNAAGAGTLPAFFVS
ncbi:MAG: hypothetical protein AAFP91_03345 [Pseudomonadota bacterium]